MESEARSNILLDISRCGILCGGVWWSEIKVSGYRNKEKVCAKEDCLNLETKPDDLMLVSVQK